HFGWTSHQAAHCPNPDCCEHFTSISAADEHDGPDGCLDPSTVPTLALCADGRTWKLADQSRLPGRGVRSGVGAPTAITVAVKTLPVVEQHFVVVPEMVA